MSSFVPPPHLLSELAREWCLQHFNIQLKFQLELFANSLLAKPRFSLLLHFGTHLSGIPGLPLALWGLRKDNIQSQVLNPHPVGSKASALILYYFSVLFFSNLISFFSQNNWASRIVCLNLTRMFYKGIFQTYIIQY